MANYLDQSETGSSSQIIFVALFSGRCEILHCLLPASRNCTKTLDQNHFAEPNQYVLTFLHQIFNLQGHTLSTGGSALTNHILFFEVFGLYHGTKVLLCHRQRDLALEMVHLLHEWGLVSQSRSTSHTIYLDLFLCLSHAT